ncbi:MAG: zinc ribbon domain-containing protein [Verrucomicrobiota bacterium]
MTTISCKQCGHENEGQRIYCHNCGVKLDRSSLPQESRPQESLEKQQRRLRKMTNPYNGVFLGWKRNLLNTVACAVMAAALIQCVRPPDGVPPTRKKGELVDAPQIVMNLEDANSRHILQRLLIDEEGINAFLGNNVKAKKIELPFLGDALKFERVFVNTDEGVCRIVQQQSFYNYSIYLASAYRLEIKGGKLEAQNVGGSIGRMPIHPRLMQTPELAFQELWGALKRDKQAMDKMQAVEVHKGNIVVVTKADPTLVR